MKIDIHYKVEVEGKFSINLTTLIAVTPTSYKVNELIVLSRDVLQGRSFRSPCFTSSLTIKLESQCSVTLRKRTRKKTGQHLAFFPLYYSLDPWHMSLGGIDYYSAPLTR